MSDTRKSDAQKPDAQKSDAQKPGTRKSAQISGTQKSGAQQSDTQQSDTQQLDHSWFKRPEVFVPQWVLGYAKETMYLYRWSWIHHEVRKTWQATEDSSFQILSFEISNVVRKRGEVRSFQIGISILDTDRLGDALANPPGDDVNLAASVVESHHWVVDGGEYSPELENEFRFGRLRYVPRHEFHEQITDIVEHKNFFLISHGPDESLPFLVKCGVHFEVLGIIDTERAVQQVLEVPDDKVGSKGDLIQEIGVECNDPRLAGNAAHFNLRILLMLIYGDVDRHPHPEGVPRNQWSLLLKRIVNSPPKKRKVARRKRSPSDSAEQIKNTSIASWVKSLQ
ncbi:QDE-2-interacting protein [Fusarium mundagurra]|uniref:QDE-2-interacting protein n=1 Tax=Fusarium mundagurra TaxID=1567541 RepID=A0A8H6DBU4_9HYPO|nr:QDE-2-interacting protein [Fusarium mundagurra]